MSNNFVVGMTMVFSPQYEIDITVPGLPSVGDQITLLNVNYEVIKRIFDQDRGRVTVIVKYT